MLQLDVPHYELTVPSTGKPITVRPFLVKEEKLLLMALQSNDNVTIINTTKQVIKSCIIEGDVDVEKLPFFDIDYLFIALRGKSVGESVEVRFSCNNLVEDKRCGTVFPVKIDIAKVDLIKNSELKDIVEINNYCKVKMKYPTYTAFKYIHDNETILDKKIRLIANSIEYIAIKNDVKTVKDLTPQEITSFIEGLTQEQYKKLEAFVDNFPYFIIKTSCPCPKCGFEHKIEYTEFESFFV